MGRLLLGWTLSALSRVRGKSSMGNYGSVGNTVYEVGICRHPMVGTSGVRGEDNGVKKVGDATDCFHRGAKVIRRFS